MTDALTYLFTAIAAVTMLAAMSIRGYLVSRYRMNLYKAVVAAIFDDIGFAADHNVGTVPVKWVWRWTEYYKVTYTEMLWKFWRSLDSFYPNLAFTKPLLRVGAR